MDDVVELWPEFFESTHEKGDRQNYYGDDALLIHVPNGVPTHLSVGLLGMSSP